MRNKIVLWGTNPQDERILVALELQIEANKVLVHTFPEAIATDDFYQQMMDQWRTNQEVAFPEGHQVLERELNITESLLPEEIKVERTDLIQRAQTEWQFVVLSSKLSQAYRSELEELEDRIGRLKNFDEQIWDSLKGFWAKVQSQLRDRTLLREHADELRDRTNKSFDSLKQLRSKREEEFRQFSKENMDKFNGFLDDIDTRIQENKALAKIFEELKKMQQELRDMDFTRDHRNKLWQRIDKAFKVVKEKRFGEKGGNSSDSSPLDRLNRRYNGLLSALEKMQRSIQRDESDLEFSQRKVNRTDGQLESQILQAKIQMIDQRISSKREKLDEMLQTKTTLEARLEKEKERQAKREEQQRVAEARDAAKEKIAQEIKAKQEELDEKADEIESAVKAVKGEAAPATKTPAAETEAKPPVSADADATAKAETTEATRPPKRDDSLLEAIGNSLSESLEDVVDTVRAVAEVVGQQLEEKMEEIKEELSREEEE